MSAIIFLCLVFVIVVMPYIVPCKRTQEDASDVMIVPGGYSPVGRTRRRVDSHLRNF